MIIVLILLGSLLFIALFAALWCGVCLLLARWSGWQALATRFPAAAEPGGETFRFTVAKIGSVRYNGILTVIKSETGLYLAVLALWRIGHPALLIPWSEMKHSQATTVLGSRWVRITVFTPGMVNIHLPAKLIEGRISAS